MPTRHTQAASPVSLPRARLRAGGAGLVLGAALLAAGCAELPRDSNGTPPTYRLAPDMAPSAPLTEQQRQRLDTLNQQILRETDAAMARDLQAEAMARAYYYPSPSWSVFYGGWGGGHWGGSVGISSPGYWGWGGYPYWW